MIPGRHGRWILAILTLLLWQRAANATTTVPCNESVFIPSHQIMAASIGNAGVNLFTPDARNCPFSTDPSCKPSLSLTAGAPVLAKILGDTACVAFVSKNGQSYVGWAEAKNLSIHEEMISQYAWHGIYQFHGAQIAIDKGDSATLTSFSGSVWIDERKPRYGSFSGYAKAEGNFVHLFADVSPCALDFERVGDYLLVRDNGACGDMGVTFNGPYRWNPLPQ